MDPIHFSHLKAMARSAAHYRHALTAEHEATRAMRIGSCVNQFVLGRSPRQPIAVFDGERRGKEWTAYKAAHSDAEILTIAEADEAKGPASAVLADPVAQALLHEARYEVPMSWTDNGMPCETSGVDIMGTVATAAQGDLLRLEVGRGYIADLKCVHNAEPEYLMRHAVRMSWHAQLAWYRGGVTLGLAHALYLLCVESSAPHPVTVLRLTPEVVNAGDRCVRAWMERLKVCLDSDSWPGYSQAPVEWTLPEWMVEIEAEDE